MERKCLFCGKVFQTERKNKVYCSKKCSTNASRKRNGIKPTLEREIVCKECGKVVITTNSRKEFCSKLCASKNYEKRRPHKSGMYIDEYLKYRKVQAEQEKNKRKVEKQFYNAIHTVERECVICGEPFYCLDSDKRLTCSGDCSKRYSNLKRDKRIPKEQIIDTDISIIKLYKRDHGKCYICGVNCSFDDWKISPRGFKYPGDTYPEIEHVIPVSRGGFHAWDNVRLACHKCNAIKKDDIIEVKPIDKNVAYSMKRLGNPPKKTLQLTMDGELVKVWDSTGQIKRELGFSDKSIQNACRGEKRSAYGFRWKYA